ncbi:MAG: SurA N-terminal domain-containing protein [Candidatus Promineifilaceae bacterium]
MRVSPMVRSCRYLLVGLASLTLAFAAGCRQAPLPTPVPSAQAPAGQTAGPTAAAPTPQPAVTSEVVAPTAPAEPTAVPATPTPSEPLAALVNGQPVTLAAYEKELARHEQAQAQLGLTPDPAAPDHRTLVLDALIESELIAQAAAANGIAVTPEMIEERLTSLIESAGGAENFAAWLQANQWTEEEFRAALGREMLTERMVELVTAGVPTAVEQVHARYIQVDDPALAQSILAEINAGGDFAALAQEHSLDRITGENGGDLGFFAAGSLLVPEVEAAAFALEAGETSEVVAGPRADGSGTTYYIVQVIEVDPQRPLPAELRFNLLQERFEAWLAEEWAAAEVVRYVEPG